MTDTPAVPAPASRPLCRDCADESVRQRVAPGRAICPHDGLPCTAPASRSGDDHALAKRWADWIMLHGERDAPVGAATAITRCYLALLSRDSGEAVQPAEVAAVLEALRTRGYAMLPRDALAQRAAKTIESLSASAARLTEEERELTADVEYWYLEAMRARAEIARLTEDNKRLREALEQAVEGLARYKPIDGEDYQFKAHLWSLRERLLHTVAGQGDLDASGAPDGNSTKPRVLSPTAGPAEGRAHLVRYESCEHDWQPDKQQAGDRCMKCQATRNAPDHYP